MNIAEKFINTHELTKEEYVELIRLAEADVQTREQLKEEAVRLQKKYYGTDVYTRGLIEFTNYCKNNCYYCGIRNGNRNAKRYRLTKEEILDCCANGYELGFRTFVLQGGEIRTIQMKNWRRLSGRYGRHIRSVRSHCL